VTAACAISEPRHGPAVPEIPAIELTVEQYATRGLRVPGAPEVGLPIATIHGLACSSEVYRPLLVCLAGRTFRREAVAVDMPGYGRATSPPRALDVAALAAWMDAALAALEIPRAHLVGHSMGCQVALALAREAPARVASATLIGPTTGRDGQGFPRYALGLMADALFESWAYNRTLARMTRQMGVRRYVQTVPAMLRDRPIARAGEVRCPVLVVRGTRDRIVSARVARRLVAALPRGRLVEVPGVAHAVQFDRPDAFVAELLPFLAEVEAGAP
jgi:2-hydroxy-6-oxonona-2,4-dienedioate hydrolase